MFKSFSLPALALAIASFALVTGCGTQPTHPDQLNAFDGATYDSLTAAHAALASLRVSISTNYPKYGTVFNQAAAAYSTALDSYTLYRTSPSNQAAVSVAIGNLAVSIVALENALQADMHASPSVALRIRQEAARLRARAGMSVSTTDILTELEIAAAVAQTIPAAQPYAALAAVVIQATSQALAAENAVSGQNIDLSLIQPVPAL